MEDRGRRDRIREVAGVFLKLGLIGFGGPAAHVALMRREVVERRRWVDEARFLDLFAASNLIPGPSSTELAISLGYARAGWPALIVAGVLFILPAAVMVLALAWAYQRFGSLPQVGWILYGVTPAVVGIVADAILRLGKVALKTWGLVVLAALVLGLDLVGTNVLILLLAGALVVAIARNRERLTDRLRRPGLGLVALLPGLGRTGATAAGAGASFAPATLFFTFLKIGAILYGGGYVLLAFLRADFVQHLHWLSDRQLLDAVAVGQVTPGPVFTTATFVGYLTGGMQGAILATVAIFLPSFVFVAAVQPALPRMRSSPWARAFLEGATASALGLMAAVTWQLGAAAVIDGWTAAIAAGAFLLLWRTRLNSALVVLGGALAGVAVKVLA